MIKSKDRDAFMAIDSVEDWLEETDPRVVENIIYGTIDYITEIEEMLNLCFKLFASLHEEKSNGV